LRCAPILKGGRGKAPLDVEALIDVIELLSGLMRSTPEITGIEVNPLLVRAQGEGVMALDAMIETELDSQGLVAIRNAGSR
jgi:succinyl-CoA synthetase beta subunit